MMDTYFSALSPRRSLFDDRAWEPACEIFDAEGHHLISIDLPGVPRDQVKIEVLGRTLTVSGERRRTRSGEADGTWYSERSAGRFSRSFTFPTELDAAQVQAQLEDGTLRLSVSKPAALRPREIPIASGVGESGAVGGLWKRLLGRDEKSVEGGDRSRSSSNVA